MASDEQRTSAEDDSRVESDRREDVRSARPHDVPPPPSKAWAIVAPQLVVPRPKPE